MKRKRDLILITQNPNVDEVEIAKQVQSVSTVLGFVEGIEMFCLSNEIIDINRYKIIEASYLVRKIITDSTATPFIFVFNKN